MNNRRQKYVYFRIRQNFFIIFLVKYILKIIHVPAGIFKTGYYFRMEETLYCRIYWIRWISIGF